MEACRGVIITTSAISPSAVWATAALIGSWTLIDLCRGTGATKGPASATGVLAGSPARLACGWALARPPPAARVAAVLQTRAFLIQWVIGSPLLLWPRPG